MPEPRPSAKPARRGPRYSTLEPRLLMDANPVAAGAPPEEVQLGEDFSFELSFQNDELAGGETGFGPFIDLIFPTAGEDGAGANGNAADPADDDGITFNSASYLGSAVDAETFVFEDTNGDGTGTILHPHAVDASGDPLEVTGNAGDTLVVLTLPFGSYTPEQPAANVQINATLSGDADLGTPLQIQTRAGFGFGADAADNPATDPSIVGENGTGAFTAYGVTPTLLSLDKVYNGPEGETATGPNFERSYTVTASIASGQTLSGFSIEDDLPDGVVLTGDFSGSSLDADGNGPTVTVDTSSGRPVVTASWAGVVSGDVAFVYAFVAPELTNGTPLIDPDTGASVRVSDPDADFRPGNVDATAEGLWTPDDARDRTGSPVSATASVEAAEPFDAKSLAVQKSVGVVGGGSAVPGAVLEYTIDFQISDFFSFDDLQLESVISDGQRLKADAAPTFSFTDRDGTATGGFTAGGGTYFTVDTSDIDGVNDGSGDTVLTFDVSGAMDAVGAAADHDRVLRGGESGATGAAAATGRVVFRTVVQDAFTDDFSSGDPSVDQNDGLTATVTATGRVLAEADLSPTGHTASDGSGAGVTIASAGFTKTLYAINGNPVGAGDQLISPGDEVTYRLTYTSPATDFEGLVFTDFLPKPVFDAGSLTGPGNGFTNVLNGDGVPDAGQAAYGPADEYFAFAQSDNASGDAIRDLPILTEEGGNAFNLAFGTADDPGNTQRVIDVLFTVEVGTEPFADGLKLTNLAQASESNTQGGSTSAPAIIQIRLGEPDVRLITGVVAVGAGEPGTFSGGAGGLGGASFAAAGTASDDDAGTTADAAFTGAVTSASLEADPIDNDLSGVDAGDVVRFATVIENTGSSPKGAYDVAFAAVAPRGFDPATIQNLQVTRGDGTELTLGTDYVLRGSGLLDLGIELVDTGGTTRGALAAGDATDGSNLVVVTYDLTASGPATGEADNGPAEAGSGALDASAGSSTLLSYTNTEGNTNFTDGTRGDDVRVAFDAPTIASATVGTGFTSSFVDSLHEAVIGETVRVRVVVEVPEGVSRDVVVSTDLGDSYAFTGITEVQTYGALTRASDGGTYDLPLVQSAVTVADQGRSFSVDLGDIANASNDNDAVHAVVFFYEAIVLDVPANVRNAQPPMLTDLAYDADGERQAVAPAPGDDPDRVRILEPRLDLTVTADADPGPGVSREVEAGEEVRYTIRLENNGPSHALQTTAYDAELGVTFEAGLGDVTVLGVTDSRGIFTAADFEFVGDHLRLKDRDPGSGVDRTFDLAPGESIELDVAATVAEGVSPGQSLLADGSLRYTSTPGEPNDPSAENADDQERLYFALDAPAQDSVVVRDVVPVKTILTSSEAHTAEAGDAATLAVGEIVRIEIAAELPRSTLANLRLADLLPEGMALRGDGDVRVSFVSDATITANELPAGADNDADPATEPLPAGRVSSSTDPGTGVTTLIFDLGDVVVGSDGTDGNPERVLLSYAAVVTNKASAEAGGGGAFAAEVLIGPETAGEGTASNTVTLAYVEPAVTDLATSVAAASGADAGDSVLFTSRFSNSGKADAFEVTLRDDIGDPADLTLDPASVSVTVGGTPVAFTNASTGNQLLIVLDDPLAAESAEVVVSYSATLSGNLDAGTAIQNAAEVSFTSLPGDGTDAGTGGNGTGLAAGTPGGTQGERTGAGGVNDHVDTDADLGTTASPTIDLLAPATAAASVGDEVTWEARVTLPEGRTRSFSASFDVPDGLAVTGWRIVPGGFAGTLPTPTQTSGGASGEDLTLSFGDLTNPADGGGGNDGFRIEFDTVVVDEAANADGARRTLLANLDFVDGQDDARDDRDATAESVTVVEPDLSVATAASGGATASDPVTFVTTVVHTPGSSATAYDLSFADAAPAGFVVTGIAGVAAAPGTTLPAGLNAASFEVAPDGRSVRLVAGVAEALDLPLGTGFELTWTASATAEALAGAAYANDAQLAWTSTDGEPGAGEPGERDGSDGVGSAPAYQQDASGLVVVEAERYHGSSDGRDSMWSVIDAGGGATAVRADPNAGLNTDTDLASLSPRLDYRVEFDRSGTHYVWVRMRADPDFPGGNDSLHIGLDGARIASSDRISASNQTEFIWTRNTMDSAETRAHIDGITAGEHTLNLWMREDGVEVDRILLTDDGSFTPGSGVGPPASAGGPDGTTDRYAAEASAERTLPADLSLTKRFHGDPAAGGTIDSAAIGDTVTVELVLDLSEGTTSGVSIAERIPAGLRLVDGSLRLLFDAGVSAPDAADAFSVAANGVDHTLSLGDVVVEPDGGSGNDRVTIRYEAVVENAAATTAATFFREAATASATAGGGVSDSGVDRLDVDEADLTLASSVIGTSRPDGDTDAIEAGDTVTYRAEVAHAATSEAGAFDLTLTDAAADGLLITALDAVSGSSGLTAADFEIVDAGGNAVTDGSGGVGIRLLPGRDLAEGQTLRVDYVATAQAGVSAGAALATDLRLTFTSTDGSNADERNGSASPGFNDHFRAASASATAGDAFELTKAVADAGGDGGAAVGETLTYTLTLELFEGTTDGVQIADVLPGGVRILDGTVAVAFGTPGTTTSNTIPATVVPSGQDLLFDLGTVVVPGDGSGSNNTVTITYDAVVENAASNHRDATLASGATASATPAAGDLAATATPASIDVDEADLTLQTAIVGTSRPGDATAGIEAGDTLTYRTSVAHAPGSEAAAYDLLLRDDAAEGLRITSIDRVLGASGLAAGDFRIVDAAGDPVAPGVGGVAIELLPGRDLGLAESFEVEYTATAQADLAAGATLASDARLTFTSTDGPNADERDGSGDSAEDDFVRSAAVAASAGDRLELTKTVSEPSGNGGAEIGETLTYTLRLALIEGVTEAVTIAERLPDGVTLVPGSVAVTGGTAGTTFGNPDAATDFVQTGRDLAFTLGDVAIPADASATNATVTLTYDVTVDNAAGLQRGTPLASAATASGGGPGVADSTDDAALAVAEPELTVATAIDGTSRPGGATSGLEAGDTVRYATTLEHAGGSDATGHDAILVIRAAPGTSFTSLADVTIGGSNALGLTAADFELFDAGGGPDTGLRLIDPGGADLGVGERLEIGYTAVVGVGVEQNAQLDAIATAAWSSLDGAVPGERDGGDGVGGPLDDYAATATGSVESGQSLAVVSSVSTPAGDGSATVGEVVTYAFAVEVPEGTTEAVVLDLVLPAAVQPVLDDAARPPALAAAAGNAGIASGFAGVASFTDLGGGRYRVDLGDVVNPDNGVDGDETVTLTFDARVLDRPANANGALPNATASVATTSGGGLTATDPQASFRVDEPELGLTKTVDNATPRLGETVTFTLDTAHLDASTATAHDLVITDAMPPGLTLDAGSVVVRVDGVAFPAGVVAGNGPGDASVRVDLSSLPEGVAVRVTYAAVVTSDPAAFGDTLDAPAGLAWDSLAADDGGTDSEDRDGFVTDTTDAPTVISGADLVVSVDDGAADRVPGETFSYAVRVENPALPHGLAARGVVVTAVVPEGLTFIGTTGAGSDWAAYDAATRTLTSTARGIATGAADTLAVDVRVDNAAASGLESFTLGASATQQDLEPTPADNAASDTDTLRAAPDYAVEVTDSVAPGEALEPGDTIRYGVVASNVGNQDGTDVVVTLRLDPAAIEDVQPSGNGVYDPATGVVTWTLPTLAAEGPGATPAPGSSAAFTVDATVRGDLSATIVSFTGDAAIADDGGDGADPDASNNGSAGVPVALEAVPNLGVTISDGLDGASPGDETAYVVTLSNAGPGQEAVNAVVEVTLPESVLRVTTVGTGPDAVDVAAIADPATGVATFSGIARTADGVEVPYTATLTPASASAEPGSGNATLRYAFASVPVGVVLPLVHNTELLDPPPSGVRSYASSVTVADDGTNGLERDLRNNTATDANSLDVFVFDSGTDARPGGSGSGFSAGPRAYGVAAGFDDGFRSFASSDRAPDPVYSGNAAPGASVSVDLYDDQGNRIGSRSVTADAAGSWSLSLPSAIIHSENRVEAPPVFAEARNFGYGHRLFDDRLSSLGYDVAGGGNTVGTLLGPGSFTAVVGSQAGTLGGGLDGETPITGFTPATGQRAFVTGALNVPAVFADAAGPSVAAAAEAARRPLAG
ncbi:DUF11 domain-containing protein [Phycisphaera mikurensis]|uniref:DUF11 domain-containing protein n=1 Tax=Phycisphaera mikurensis (strain NBRC 102666 / KCTC 22515 / FYK2301M01) TaxID=1142394 RepID=I0ICD4_PHYMF|nr:DUF11 domain-containing protein [Phycisphaera mikurensis]MBB6442200.1 fimbrial isopeptide formation D2 family protein [Phycisphaera mikurensis]BAM02922.1 hypothetical protein PSMK_07630 [Phycisphaera mikurensis NBRC 102666]